MKSGKLRLTTTQGLKIIAIGAAAIGLGIAMPSCPGQQAMQQQIDALAAKNTELVRQTQAYQGQIQTLNNEIAEMKKVLENLSTVVLAQKTQMEQMDGQIKALATKPAPVKAAAASKKKRK